MAARRPIPQPGWKSCQGSQQCHANPIGPMQSRVLTFWCPYLWCCPCNMNCSSSSAILPTNSSSLGERKTPSIGRSARVAPGGGGGLGRDGDIEDGRTHPLQTCAPANPNPVQPRPLQTPLQLHATCKAAARRSAPQRSAHPSLRLHPVPPTPLWGEARLCAPL